jgi:hypothetical protein
VASTRRMAAGRATACRPSAATSSPTAPSAPTASCACSRISRSRCPADLRADPRPVRRQDRLRVRRQQVCIDELQRLQRGRRQRAALRLPGVLRPRLRPAQTRRRISEKLLAGIGTHLREHQPLGLRGRRDRLRSRTPQEGSLARSEASKAALLGAVKRPSSFIGAVEVQRRAGSQQRACPAQQRLAGRPRRDVDHVDAHDRVGLASPATASAPRPAPPPAASSSARAPPPRPRCSPAPPRHARSAATSARQRRRKAHRVLPGATGDFEHEPAVGQDPHQHRQDSLPIALRCLRGPPVHAPRGLPQFRQLCHRVADPATCIPTRARLI